MFNILKQTYLFPRFLTYSNITTVHKSGSKLELSNERGVNRVSVIRSIYMRMLYNMKYDSIDENISDGQMGGRKNKGCRNNLFLINGIIFDILKSNKAKPALIQIYDYSQMFDAIQLEQALIDLYQYGVQDETLGILYNANKEIDMAVKTVYGQTERQTVNSTVLQGETWASLLASVQVDSISKECQSACFGYLYKQEICITNLGLIDDFLGITEPGFKAQQMNSFFNIKTA